MFYYKQLPKQRKHRLWIMWYLPSVSRFRDGFSHKMLWLTALDNKEKYQFLLRIFFLPSSLYENKQIRKINCCPDWRFLESTCIWPNDRHCGFGSNIPFSHPKTHESMRHVLHKPSLRKQLRAEEPKGVACTWDSGYKRQTIFPFVTLNTLSWKCDRRSHLWGHVCGSPV